MLLDKYTASIDICCLPLFLKVLDFEFVHRKDGFEGASSEMETEAAKRMAL